MTARYTPRRAAARVVAWAVLNVATALVSAGRVQAQAINETAEKTPLAASAPTLGADRLRQNGPLTLTQAVQIGLRENLMIRAANADVQAAGYDTRIARSQTRPQISANTYLAFGDSSNILYTAGNVMPQNYLSVPSQGFADQNLTLMAPLYTSGRLQEGVKAASQRERAIRFDAGGVRAEVALRITDAYYRALLGIENVKSAQARVGASAALVQTTQALFEAGKGLQSSVLRVQAEQADAQRVLTTARNTQAKALLDLKAAMGVRLDSDVTLRDALTFTVPIGGLAAQLADAARLRPELLAARTRALAAQSQTRSVRGSQGPQVYGMAMADGFASHPQQTRTGYTVGVVLSLPLVDGGQRRAESAQAQARQERALSEARDMELRVGVEVQEAWLDVQTAAENYRTAQAALASAQSAYDVTALRVQNQKGLLVEQLDALATLTQARGNVAQALYDHSIAGARLSRAVGRPAGDALNNMPNNAPTSLPSNP